MWWGGDVFDAVHTGDSIDFDACFFELFDVVVVPAGFVAFFGDEIEGVADGFVEVSACAVD